MVMMKMRGVTPEEFAIYHPGGRLGRQLLLRVHDTMRGGEENPVIDINDSIADMLYRISSKRCGAVSVVDNQGGLLGLVTDYDIRKELERRADFFAQSIADVMNKNPIHIYSDELAVTALEVMRDRPRPFLVLPVLDRESEKVVGLVHLHDLMAKGL